MAHSGDVTHWGDNSIVIEASVGNWWQAEGMAREQLDAIRQASQNDPELHAALEAAGSVQEWVVIAKQRGFEVEVEDLPDASTEREISDAELEGVAGGYTFPPTDWIYCDNPWTNMYCTLKC